MILGKSGTRWLETISPNRQGLCVGSRSPPHTGTRLFLWGRRGGLPALGRVETDGWRGWPGGLPSPTSRRRLFYLLFNKRAFKPLDAEEGRLSISVRAWGGLPSKVK